jgi:formate dehydrogenase subunit gamma
MTDDAIAGEVRAIAAEHGDRPDALIEMLHAVQHRFGYVPEAAVPALALAINRSRAEVHGVVTFYHDFRDQPAGRKVIKICRAEACQAMGARELIHHAERVTGARLGGTSPDGAVTLEAVYCLGNCALSPAVLADGELVGRVDAARFDALLAERRAAE